MFCNLGSIPASTECGVMGVMGGGPGVPIDWNGWYGTNGDGCGGIAGDLDTDVMTEVLE